MEEFGMWELDNFCWYAIRTKPNQEDRADANLRAWGVETVAPKWIDRRVNEFSSKVTHITRPLFPGYIFARFAANELLHKVIYTRGVNNVVCFAGLPVPVDDEAIELLRSRSGDDGFVRLHDELSPGDKVIIKDGPFRNLSGVFDKNQKDAERVSILLTAIKYQNRVMIDRGLLKKVA
jgi:transcriptional antiterminator RfaH